MRPIVAFLIGAGLMSAWQGADSYTSEKETALGRQLAADLRARTTALESPTLRAFVERIGGRLASQMPGGIPFTFAVIAEDPCAVMHEPVAQPGGYVFVPAALFLEARDEAEFAAVLAHAMEHTAAHHGTRQPAQGAIISYASIPLIFMGGMGGGFCDSGGVAIPRGFLTSLRGFEREADFLAVQTLARAGYDPGALARYVERVQPPGGPRADSPLPARESRVAAISEEIATLPLAGGPSPAPDDFDAIQQEVRGLAQEHPAPEPPRLRRKAP